MRGNVAIIINVSLCARAGVPAIIWFATFVLKTFIGTPQIFSQMGASLHVWIIKVWKVPTGMSILCPCRKDTDVML